MRVAPGFPNDFVEKCEFVEKCVQALSLAAATCQPLFLSRSAAGALAEENEEASELRLRG